MASDVCSYIVQKSSVAVHEIGSIYNWKFKNKVKKVLLMKQILMAGYLSVNIA